MKEVCDLAVKFDIESVRILLQSGLLPKDMVSRIMFKSMASSMRRVSDSHLLEMIQAGPDPNAIDEYGSPLLFRVILHQSSSPNYPVLRAFVALPGLNLNAKTRDGSTALHLAYLWGGTEKAEILMRAGADPRIRDPQGRMPYSLGRNLPRPIQCVDPEPYKDEPILPCLVCMERNRYTVHLPCGHMILCKVCVDANKKGTQTCVLCKAPIQKNIEVEFE
jgi:hypothetical protein